MKIPIQFGYAIELDRWSLSLLAGTSLNFQLNRFKRTNTEEKDNSLSFCASGIVNLQAGYFIGNSTIIHIEPHFEKTFVSSKNTITPTNQISLGFGLKQFF